MTSFCNFFPAAKKLPRKVARRLSVFFCLPLRSLPGAAELAPLKQSSPYFRLLPRSRQPDKGGHFSSPTLPAIKGKGGSLLSFRARPIGRRGISMSSRTKVRDLIQNTRLGGDASLRSAWTSSRQEILQGKAFLNDIVPIRGYIRLAKDFSFLRSELNR